MFFPMFDSSLFLIQSNPAAGHLVFTLRLGTSSGGMSAMHVRVVSFFGGGGLTNRPLTLLHSGASSLCFIFLDHSTSSFKNRLISSSSLHVACSHHAAAVPPPRSSCGDHLISSSFVSSAAQTSQPQSSISSSASSPRLLLWGANTDVGKTLVSAAISAAILRTQTQLLYLKPVQTGFPRDSDARRVVAVCQALHGANSSANVWGPHATQAAPEPSSSSSQPPANPTTLVAHTRFAWNAAVSPHAAAHAEGLRGAYASAIRDDLEDVIQHNQERVVLVETAGGPLSPTADGTLQADALAPIASKTPWHNVLVADARLGGISATLAAGETLSSRGMVPRTIVLLDEKGEESGVPFDNAGAISTHAAKGTHVAVAPTIREEESLVDWVARTSDEVDKIVECIVSYDQPKAELPSPTTSTCPYESARTAVTSSSSGDDFKMPAWHAVGSAHVWLPYMQHLTAPPAIAVRAARGGRLLLHDDGRFDARFRDEAEGGLVSIVDGASSWWTACHGYAHTHIASAVASQMARAPHVMLGGMLHEPASVLASRLAAIAPVARNDDDEGRDEADATYAADPRWSGARVFFSESGSVSVEVAIKVALQYHMNRGRTARRHVAYLKNAYHGDTLGTMAVCDPEEGMHTKFAGALPAHGPMITLPLRHGVGVAPAPRGLASGHLTEAESEAVDAAIEKLLASSDHLAALVVEPLVQGAGGFTMYHPEALRRLANACRSRDIVLIADEIMTGFGRITGADGELFACSMAGVRADVVTVSKALTGGTCALAATIASPRLFRAFLSSTDPEACLMHGPTYSGNPLACAAANASLDLFGVGYPDGVDAPEEALSPREDRLDQVSRMEAHFSSSLAAVRQLPGVHDVRVTGALAVVQLDHMLSSTSSSFLKDRFLRAHGCFIRPFRDVVYLAPPFVLDASERDRLCTAVSSGLSEWAEERSKGRL